MTKKYEFVSGDYRQLQGKTVTRIRYLVDILQHSIKSGDLGGYIESENNLSHRGDASVSDNASVFGNARVSDDARVSGDASVSDNASVFGNARVSGTAMVSGTAIVFGIARVSGNARVSDDARVSGTAIVSGNARVSDDARVSGTAIVSNNARVSGTASVSDDADTVQIGPAKSSGRFTTAHKDEKIGVRVNCGCFSGSIDEFERAIEQTHAGNEVYLKQYKAFVTLIRSNFE